MNWQLQVHAGAAAEPAAADGGCATHAA